MTEVPKNIASRTFTCKIKGNNKKADQSGGERFNNIQGQLEFRKPIKPAENTSLVKINLVTSFEVDTILIHLIERKCKTALNVLKTCCTLIID